MHATSRTCRFVCWSIVDCFCQVLRTCPFLNVPWSSVFCLNTSFNRSSTMSPLACSRHNLKGPDLKSNCFLYFISHHILFSLLKGLLLFAAKQVEQFKLINSDTYILVKCGYTPTCWIDEWFAYRFLWPFTMLIIGEFWCWKFICCLISFIILQWSYWKILIAIRKWLYIG